MNALPPLITRHLDEVRALCEKYRVKLAESIERAHVELYAA